ncbi:hypothetical protein OIU78_028894 [Salix suchowensis]|nr:hypothetical protein OIU78_028894 [Salix suchowensis]
MTQTKHWPSSPPLPAMSPPPLSSLAMLKTSPSAASPNPTVSLTSSPCWNPTNPTPQIKQEPFLSSLIRSYGVAGMFDQALKTYQEMDQLGTPRSCISFNSLLSACIQSKLYNKVPVLFNEISEKYRVLPDKVSYGMLVKAYCEDGKPEKAIEVLGGMEKKGLEVTTIVCTPVLNCLYSKGKNEEADRFLDWMVERGCELDAVVYNVKISNAVNQGAERVKELIEEMKNSGLKPDTISYNYLMTSYCRSGMMEEAKKVYEGLTVHGCKANQATYRTLVFNLCKNGEYEKGYKIFRDSVREHRIPDFNTLKYLAKGLVEKKKIKEAKGLIHTMKKKFPPNLLNAWRKLEENLGLQSTEERQGSQRGYSIRLKGGMFCVVLGEKISYK